MRDTRSQASLDPVLTFFYSTLHLQISTTSSSFHIYFPTPSFHSIYVQSIFIPSVPNPTIPIPTYSSVSSRFYFHFYLFRESVPFHSPAPVLYHFHQLASVPLPFFEEPSPSIPSFPFKALCPLLSLVGSWGQSVTSRASQPYPDVPL